MFTDRGAALIAIQIHPCQLMSPDVTTPSWIALAVRSGIAAPEDTACTVTLFCGRGIPVSNGCPSPNEQGENTPSEVPSPKRPVTHLVTLPCAARVGAFGSVRPAFILACNATCTCLLPDLEALVCLESPLGIEWNRDLVVT